MTRAENPDRRWTLGAGLAGVTSLAFPAVAFAALRPACIPDTETLQIGVCCHYGMYDEPLSTFDTLLAMGLRSFRDEAYWDHVEKSPGVLKIPPHVQAWYDLAVKHAMDPILILSYGHPHYQNGQAPTTQHSRAAFVRYVSFVAEELPGIRRFQLWNEWELKAPNRTAGTARDYLDLVRVVSPALKALRPDAVLLPAGIHRDGLSNGYLQELIRGGLLEHVDGVAAHTYRFDQPDPSPEAWFGHLMRLKADLAIWSPGGRDCNLYVTEMGAPSNLGKHGLSPEAQADYLERCMLLATVVPQLRGLWWYGLRDKGVVPWESEHRYGLLDRYGEPKPAGRRIKLLIERLKTIRKSVLLFAKPGGEWVVGLETDRGKHWRVSWQSRPKGDTSFSQTRPQWVEV